MLFIEIYMRWIMMGRRASITQLSRVQELQRNWSMLSSPVAQMLVSEPCRLSKLCNTYNIF